MKPSSVGQNLKMDSEAARLGAMGNMSTFGHCGEPTFCRSDTCLKVREKLEVICSHVRIDCACDSTFIKRKTASLFRRDQPAELDGKRIIRPSSGRCKPKHGYRQQNKPHLNPLHNAHEPKLILPPALTQRTGFA